MGINPFASLEFLGRQKKFIAHSEPPAPRKDLPHDSDRFPIVLRAELAPRDQRWASRKPSHGLQATRGSWLHADQHSAGRIRPPVVHERAFHVTLHLDHVGQRDDPGNIRREFPRRNRPDIA